MIANFTIYGERCSGTNYLEECIKSNFNVNYVTKYGHKHFFGFSDLSNSDDTLFICIVRDPVKWINSFYRVPHHLIDVNCHSIKNFLNNPIVSFEKNPISLNGQKDQGKELETDRNIYTKEPYSNIFELRHVKNKYLLEVLPTLVEHCIFIRYEDLMDNFEKTMNAIKAKGLVPLNSVMFPMKVDTTKPIKGWMNLGKKQDEIAADEILNHPNFIKEYDCQLGYLGLADDNDDDACHFTFIQGKSQINHDLKRESETNINNKSQLSRNDKINKYMKSARNNADCAGFSTLGYYKSQINTLTDSKFFNKDDGTYIKKIYSDGMYICGCVKNCGKFLKKVLENLHFLSAVFYRYEIIIAYDESTDNSLEILKNMSKVMNLTILYNHNTSKFRAENISNARNSILDYIRARTERQFKYFIMVDMDDVSAAPLNINVLHKYLKEPEKWDALSFNQKEYYDIWALSIDDYVCSCWHFETNPKNKAVEVMKKYITNKLKNALCENELVECVSAFNGFGVYKIDVFLESKYQTNIRTTLKLISAAQIRKNEQAMQSRFNITSGHSMCDCEHRYFHLNAKRLNPNIKICISPLCLFGEDTNESLTAIKEVPLLNSEEHCEYVSSWGLLKSCDVTPLTHNTTFDLTRSNTASKPTVLFMESFMESGKLHNLVKIINKVQTRIILVTGDSDATIPGDIFKNHKEFVQFIETDKIVHWFSQNCTATHSKLSPMPIGMDYHTRINTTRWGPKVPPLSQETQLKEIRDKAKPFWEREIKCYSNYQFLTNTRYGKIDRTSAMKEIPKEIVFYEPESNKKDRHVSWEKQINYGFVVSPLGNGYDCHRTWEALLLGCIVVMKRNAIDRLFADLPVLLVDEWNQVTQELLDATVKEYRNKTFCYKKLTLKYWTDLIKSHQIVK